jgi:BarA-like signal transduction histidine kinase
LAVVEPRQTASQVSRSIHAKGILRGTAEQFGGRVNQQHFDLLVVGLAGIPGSMNKSSAAPPSVSCAWRHAPSWW